MCTVYCSIAELFKSDDEVKISAETEDVPNLTVNLSALRPPTGMSHYSLESSCCQDSKEYEINPRGGLRAEQFVIEVSAIF